MISTFTRQHGSLQGISIDSTPATDPGSLLGKIKAALEQAEEANEISEAMRAQLEAIETQRATCDRLWADVLVAQATYEDAVDWYNDKASPEEQVKTIYPPQHPHVNSLYVCPGRVPIRLRRWC